MRPRIAFLPALCTPRKRRGGRVRTPKVRHRTDSSRGELTRNEMMLLCDETLSGSFCHAHLDDWPLNAQHRGFHFIAGRERNQTRSGCADVSRVEPLSAVRSRGVSEIFTRERYSLRTFPRAGRKAKTEPQFAQHSMAQRVIPRLRGLHGDSAIPERHRTPSHSRSRGRTRCDDVRGSSVVALPSLADLRLSPGVQYRGDTHPRCK